jgi:light-regulated signal transduction histidine kinase (bacteriophytochrome)
MNIRQADLASCEREPIHILGHIQSYGYLIAIQPERYTIVHVSQNIAQLVGVDADQLLGQPIQKLLEQTNVDAHSLVELLNVGSRHNTWDTMNPYRQIIGDRTWNLILHQHNGLILLEWEPSGDHTDELTNQQLVAQALTEVQSSRNLTDLLHNTAQRVKTIIGFDRVMVYRFGADWHGKVVAEAREPHLEPFLGLHYPASDIPKQARELYKVNLVRLIADAKSQASPIVSLADWPANKPLDLTHSVLRAVSPVHIEYLNNMGVQASMSISLLYRGELWGLISCHHYSPRVVSFPARQTAKFVSQLLSAALEFRKDEEDQTFRLQSLQNGQALHEQLLEDGDVVRALLKHPITALDVTKGGGVAVLFNGQFHKLGQTPDETTTRALTEWLRSNNTETFFQTDRLPTLYPPASAFRDVGAGLLAITLSPDLDEYVLWFKPEQVQEVTWAGNPDKAVTIADDGQHRLSPRKSFAAWTQTVRDTSKPWSEAEVSTVVKLREDILQVITRQANEIRLLNQRLQAAYEELDAFSYTVSHDLRTPLSSIRCYSEILVEEYGENFNDDAQLLFKKIIDSTDRMRALIRHILHYSRMGRTDLNEQAIDMKTMLQGIREEFLLAEKDRQLTIDVASTPVIKGDSVMINQLFTNLIGNAVKYTRLTPKAHIMIKGHQANGEVIYSIVDNGIGFDMKHSGKIFDLFKRLENARQFEGSGVGMAIVKRIINRHEGKIWFQSEPGRGTSFFVAFPESTVQ